MIGKLHFNCLQLTYGYAGNNRNGWSAKATFADAGFNDDQPEFGLVSIEGELRTRYSVSDEHGDWAPVMALNALLQDLVAIGAYNLEDTIVFITNREDEELGKGGIPAVEIPEAHKTKLKEAAEANGFSFHG